MDKQKIEQYLISILNEYDVIKLAIVFGSFVGNSFRKESDIDIAVASNNKIKYDVLIEIQKRISKKVDKEVDILDFNRLDGFILNQILTKGKVLIKKDVTLYANIIQRMLEFQEDIYPNMKKNYKKRLKRFIDG